MIIPNSLLKPATETANEVEQAGRTPLVQAIMSQFNQLKRPSFYFGRQSQVDKQQAEATADRQLKSWVVVDSTPKKAGFVIDATDPVSIARS